MSALPTGVGNSEAQKRFIEGNRAFLEEYPKLFALYSKVFIRAVAPPSETERQSLLQLSDDDPAVLAFENREMAGLVIFYLGRMAADDLGEIITLSGNGLGFGACKIVRGMYERVVTSMYIAKNPSESRAFVESSPIHKLNYINHLVRAAPELKERYNDEFIQRVKADADAAQAKRKQSVCPKCRQPITQDAWTRVNLDTMARTVDPSLEVLYPQFYLEGTLQSHANMLGIERRLIERGGGYTYRDTSEPEARLALHLGHHLMVKLLGMQNEYFNLGFAEELQGRIDAFVSIWGKTPNAAPESE